MDWRGWEEGGLDLVGYLFESGGGVWLEAGIYFFYYLWGLAGYKMMREGMRVIGNQIYRDWSRDL